MLTVVIPFLAFASARLSSHQATSQASVIARLSEIAQDLGTGTGDPTAELTEAVRMIGFGIWKDDVKSFAPQTSNSPMHLAITDGEIRDYGKMCRMNQGTRLGDLEGAFDDMVSKLGAHISVTDSVNGFLADSALSSKQPVFYLQTFLRDLNAFHRLSPNSTFTADTVLDPVQTLLLMRVISEDIGAPIRKHLKARSKDPLLEPYEALDAATIHRAGTDLAYDFQAGQAGQQPMPGWAEDLYVGTIGQIYGAIDAWENQPGSTGSQILSGLTYLNGAMSLIKFVSAYVKLEGDIELTPGPPLVRTTDTLEQGELATLKATFKLNGDPTSDTLQSLRSYLALIGGMDLGQPTAAPLKGVETEWLIGQSTKFASKQTIETQRGKSVNLAKVVTDDQGVASVPIAGKPQRNAIDKATAQKVTKHIVIKVTPQVASNNVMGDTINIALGIRSGPAGMMSIVEGFLQHMKWQGTVNYDLQVTDWLPGDLYGTLTVDLDTTYTNRDLVSTPNQDSLSRHISIENAKLRLISAAAPQVPTIDPNLLKNLTAAQQAQVAAALAKAQANLPTAPATNSRRYEVIGDVGTWKMKIQDSSYRIDRAQRQGEATHGMRSTNSSAIGNSEGSFEDGAPAGAGLRASASFGIEVHPTEGFLLISVNATCPVDVHHALSDEDQPAQNYNKTDQALLEIFSGLTPPADGIKVPYRPSNSPDGSIGGSVTVPFTFHGQPCNVIISFSIVGKKRA